VAPPWFGNVQGSSDDVTVPGGGTLTVGSNILGTGDVNVDGTLNFNGVTVGPDINVGSGGNLNVNSGQITTGTLNLEGGGTITFNSVGSGTIIGDFPDCPAGSTVNIVVGDVNELTIDTDYTGFNYNAGLPASTDCTVNLKDNKGGSITLEITNNQPASGRRLLSASSGSGTFGQQGFSFSTSSGGNAASALAPTLLLGAVATLVAAVLALRA